MAMKPQDFKDAQDIVDGLKQARLGRRDLVALLIYVREHLPNDMVRDIAHCVAHSDRDRGYVYAHIESFVSNLVQVAQQGGTLRFDPIFDKANLIPILAADLQAIGFNITDADIRNSYQVLEASLKDILVDTEILLRHPNVDACRFEQRIFSGTPDLGFVVYTKGLGSGPVFKLPDGFSIACAIFS